MRVAERRWRPCRELTGAIRLWCLDGMRLIRRDKEGQSREFRERQSGAIGWSTVCSISYYPLFSCSPNGRNLMFFEINNHLIRPIRNLMYEPVLNAMEQFPLASVELYKNLVLDQLLV